MEKKNAFLGKDIDGGLLYLNNGKYGYFITNKINGNSQNYKVPEYLKPEEITVDLAQRIIQYKKKISKQYLVPQDAFNNDTENDCDEDGDKCDGKITELKIKKNKV
jgi:topoisomerase IA-like protein